MRSRLSILCLLLAACSSTPSATDAPTPPTSTSPVVAGADATPSPDGSAPANVPSASPTTPRNGAASNAPADTVGSIDEPPSPGTYTYRQDGYQTFGTLRFDFDPEGSFEVAAPEPDGTTTRQRTIRRYSSNRERESLTLFRSDAILLEEAIERIGSGSARQTYTCRTPDPVPLLPIPWRVGSSWSGGGDCDGLSLDYEATLRAVEQREVGGTEVRSLVIDAAYTIEGDDLRQETTATIWFAPDHRLVVRQVESSSGTFSGTPFERELTEELVSLTPA